jgi:hypothetical protein
MKKYTYAAAAEPIAFEAGKPIAERLDETTKLLQTLPNSFGDALSELMRWRGCTNEELSERSLLSGKTIQRFRTEPDYNPSLPAVVAVCIGLNLPPYMSCPLIHRAGLAFKPTRTHTAYQMLLAEHWRGNVSECNRTLDSLRIPRIGGTG